MKTYCISKNLLLEMTMRSGNNYYLHNLSVKTILQLLASSAWQTENQSITSAITNDNFLPLPDQHYQEIGENTAGPNAFCDIPFLAPVKRILDVGGGRFDCNRDYMKKRHIDLLVWDPFNRSTQHNESVREQISCEQVDAATSMSVLNVIPEVEARIAHITTLKTALRDGGYAYFKVWAGEAPFSGSYFPTQTATYYQANAHAARFLKEIAVVFGVNNVWLDQVTPNLIVAKKTTATLTAKKQVMALVKASLGDEVFFTKKIKTFLQMYYANEQQTLLNNYSLFRKFADTFITKNKGYDDKLQREFDKQYGMVSYRK